MFSIASVPDEDSAASLMFPETERSFSNTVMGSLNYDTILPCIRIDICFLKITSTHWSLFNLPVEIGRIFTMYV